MKKRKIAVIGLGKFGINLVKFLSEKDVEVIAIDSDASKLEKVRDIATETLQLDSTDKEALEKSGIVEADVVVVGIGENIEASILTTTLLKELGAKEIIARAINSLHAQILQRAGASRIVFPEKDMAVRLGHFILYPGIRDYLKLIGRWDISEIEIGPGSQFIGKTLKEIAPRSKYHVNILMIEKVKERPTDSEVEAEIIKIKEFPREDYLIEERDILITSGEDKNLEDFEKACAE